MPTHVESRFESIVSEHRSFIRRTLSQLGIPRSDLDDVEQEVLCGVERGLSSFEPSPSLCPQKALRAWIYGICVRQVANHRRAARERAEVISPVEDFDQRSSGVPGAEARWIERERMALLHTMLAGLEPKRRAVLVAYELDETPMRHVALELGISCHTAWSRLRLARADLHAIWRRMSRAAHLAGP